MQPRSSFGEGAFRTHPNTNTDFRITLSESHFGFEEHATVTAPNSVCLIQGT